MITHDPLITPSELQARVKSQPIPSREELMKRNSFGSVNNNRYLNRCHGAELESRKVALPRPACTYADHSYPAYSEKQVVELLESLGINLETGGE